METTEQILIKVEKNMKKYLKMSALKHDKTLKDLMVEATLEWIVSNGDKLNKK